MSAIKHPPFPTAEDLQAARDALGDVSDRVSEIRDAALWSLEGDEERDTPVTSSRSGSLFMRHASSPTGAR